MYNLTEEKYKSSLYTQKDDLLNVKQGKEVTLYLYQFKIHSLEKDKIKEGETIQMQRLSVLPERLFILSIDEENGLITVKIPN
jgi:hypothetical protein